ncbi:hypothetical protein [Methylobacterium sp. J-026]|uniref:hypothetical protein n=1 Tax=Methylobacterium sp. J-026 TaxID=2836624 RepID=UPI001FBBA7F9|nr:hypothetical protein [Methylobacterium sp. J-026]
MLFTIVSERAGVSSRDTRTTPHEALLLASTLVQGGVEKVWVFDARGVFVSASALQQMARERAEPAETQAVVVSGTTDLLARDPEPARPGDDAAAAGEAPVGTKGPVPKNGRVFRMATQRY